MNIPSRKQQAWTLYNTGQLVDASHICEEICAASGADAESFYLLGSCYGSLGRYADAVAAFEDSLRIQPDVPTSLFALGSALTNLGHFEEAAKKLNAAIAIKPHMAEAHCALADVLATLGFTNDAREHYEKARTLRPDMGAPYIGLGKIAGNSIGDQRQAIEHFQAAVNREPDAPGFRCSLAMALAEAGRHQEAHDNYLEALRIAPDFSEALSGVARLLGLKGKYEKAMELIELMRCKKIYSSTAAIAFTSICRHLDNCEDAVEYAEKSLENKLLTRRSRESLHMNTARALDYMDRYDEAWQHFTTGNKVTTQLFDTVAHRLRTEKMINVFSRTGLLGFPSSNINSKRPIFIVGMPRSGTSLVEQIVAAHPKVCGGGELTFISDLSLEIPRFIGSQQTWPDCAPELHQDDINILANRYLDRLNEVSKTAELITDKMPQNFHALGLIQLLFPESQIIHCIRDPLDTCLSIYFQNFLDGHDYSRNLYHIGTYYHQYQRLMKHWRSHLSIPILDVQYEELVREPEYMIRRILKHCKLEWHDGCMEFHKVKRFVKTASYDQVRQPMYTRSIGRWRHYKKYLGDLINGLERGF